MSPFFDAGRQPLATLGWPASAEEAQAMTRLPQDFVQCPACTHVWNRSLGRHRLPGVAGYSQHDLRAGHQRADHRSGHGQCLHPPLVNNRISQTGSPNSCPTYDLLGRRMSVGVTANF